LKRWGVVSLVGTDFLRRAIPWQHRSRGVSIQVQIEVCPQGGIELLADLGAVNPGKDRTAVVQSGHGQAPRDSYRSHSRNGNNHRSGLRRRDAVHLSSWRPRSAVLSGCRSGFRQAGLNSTPCEALAPNPFRRVPGQLHPFGGPITDLARRRVVVEAKRARPRQAHSRSRAGLLSGPTPDNLRTRWPRSRDRSSHAATRS
jgi:hypothetical protein